MGQTKKPRKRYRPKSPEGPQLPVTIRFSSKAETDLQVIPHVELDAIMRGKGTEYSLGAVNFRINCGYVLAGETFADEQLRAAMEAGLNATRAMLERWRTTGRIGCTGEQFRAIGAALELCDAMQLRATRRELRDASNIVERVVEWKLHRGEQ